MSTDNPPIFRLNRAMLVRASRAPQALIPDTSRIGRGPGNELKNV